MASFKRMSHYSPKKLGSRKLEKSFSQQLQNNTQQQDHYRRLLSEDDDESSSESSTMTKTTTTPTGCVAIYVGEEGQRFTVPTGFLSHPLFRMILEKANEELGLDHYNKLGLITVPCSVPTFMQVLNAVESCKGSFQFGKQLVDDLL